MHIFSDESSGNSLPLGGELKIYNMNYDKDLEEPTTKKYQEYADHICAEVLHMFLRDRESGLSSDGIGH